MKKAKIKFSNGTTNVIDITEDIDYRFRIIEELSGMSMENNPVLHPKDHLKDLPLIYWNPDDFTNETHEKIEEVLKQRELEFEEIFSKHILEKLGITLKENEFFYFGDSYLITKEEEEQGITIHYEITIEDVSNYYVNIVDDIKKNEDKINNLVNKYKNVRDAHVSIQIFGNEEEEIAYGVCLNIMLNLNKFDAESIAELVIGYCPYGDLDEDDDDILLLSKDVKFKNFSVQDILNDIDFFQKNVDKTKAHE